MNELSKELLLADVPYEILRRLEQQLAFDDAWKEVAESISSECTDLIETVDIRTWERAQAPVKEFLNRLFQQEFTVGLIYGVLEECRRFDILRIFITDEKPKVLYPTDDQYHEVRFGDSLKIEAHFSGTSVQLQWYRNDTAIEGKTEHTLIIDNFQKADCGIYKCQARQTIDGGNEHLWSKNFSVALKELRPTLLPGKDLSDVTLETGGELILKAEFASEPEPTNYVFFKNGKEFMQSDVCVLKITNVGVKDGGKYYCEAHNIIGCGRSREITVSVKLPSFAPDILKVNIPPRPSTVSSLGACIDYFFRVHSKHPVTFSCSVNGAELDNWATVSSTHHDNEFHDFYLRYEVTAKDWLRGNKEKIILLFTASSNGHEVSSQARIQVEMNAAEEEPKARGKWALIIANEEYAAMPLKTPVNDMKSLASKLVRLDFRCMMCRNLTKSEFSDILNLFSSFLQEGDYVVFYYAGHGFYNQGVDYMIPVNTLESPNGVEEAQCIASTNVINCFQSSDPALILYIHDTCRGSSDIDVRPRVQQVPFRISKGNSCTIYATSENYKSYEEVESGSSLLMSYLINHIEDQVPVHELGSKVLQGFRYICEDGVELQKPRVDFDINSIRSLTDPCCPHDKDHTTVLAKWEKWSNLGGTRINQLVVDDLKLEIQVKCEQEDYARYPRVISNNLNVIINITPLDNVDVTVLRQKRLTVCIIPNNSGKEKEAEVIGKPIEYPVMDLQALLDELQLTLCFKKEKDYVGECHFNLESPSLCDLRNAENNLDIDI